MNPAGTIYGSGIIGGPVSTVSVGVGGGSNGTLYTLMGNPQFAGGLTMSNNTVINIGNANPHFQVTGNLTLGQDQVVNIIDVNISPGTYPLFTYTGTLSGNTSTWTIGDTTNEGDNDTYTFSTATPGQVDLIIGTGVSNRSTYTGKGGNSNWSTAANWQTGSAPAPGNEILFNTSPSGSVNDFPANTQFNGIRFYTVGSVDAGGNPINLGGNIYSDVGSNQLDMNLATAKHNGRRRDQIDGRYFRSFQPDRDRRQ